MGKRFYRLLAAALAIVGICVFLNDMPNDWYNASFTPVYDGPAREGKGYEVAYELDMLQSGRYGFYMSYGDIAQADSFALRLYTAYAAGEDGKAPRDLPIENLAVNGEVLYFETEITGGETRGIELWVGYGDVLYPALLDIQGQQRVYNDSFLLLGISLLCAASCLLYGGRQGKRAKADRLAERAFWVCMCIGLAASLPLLRAELGHGDDIGFHFERIQGIYEGLRGGQFPVRLTPHFSQGAGQPVSIMYPDIFLYIPALLRFAGVSVVGGYRLAAVFANISCALLTYICIYKLCGRRSMGLLASFAFTLSTYRMSCLYTRAALGEVLAMSFMPCLILGLYEVLYRDERKWGWLALGALGLLASHMLTVQMCALFGLAVVVFSLKWLLEKGRFFALVKAGLAVLVLGLYFFVPMLTVWGLDFRIFSLPNAPGDHGTALVHLFDSFTPTIQGQQNAGTVMGAAIVLFLAGLFFAPVQGDEDKRLVSIGGVCLALGGLGLFMGSALFPWAAVQRIPVIGPFLETVQFSWRYFGIASVLLSVVFAIGVYRLCAQQAWKAVLGGGLACTIAIVPYMGGYVANAESYDRTSELYLLAYVDYVARDTVINEWQKPNAGLRFSADDVAVSGYEKQGVNVQFEYEAAEAVDFVELPLYLYPGYSAVDGYGETLEIVSGENHRMRVLLGESSGSVAVRYKGLWVYRVADGISLLGALALGGGWLYRKKKRVQANA